MYQSSTPYGQDPYRGAPVAGPMRPPYNNGVPAGYNPAMQYQQQQPQRYTSPPQTQPPPGAFRQQPMPQQQYVQQQYPGQGYPQQRGDTGRPHKGTLPPGQMVRVGQHAVRVERYLSEGGYAHVYLTSSDKPVYPPKRSGSKGRWGEKGYTTHCLKRIAFEDENVWRDVSREIEVMVSRHHTQARLTAESTSPKSSPHPVPRLVAPPPPKWHARGVHPHGVLLRCVRWHGMVLAWQGC